MPSQGEVLDNWCRRVRDAAMLAHGQVEPAFLESPLVDIAYAIKSRVKPKPKIYDKVLRKRKDPKKPRPDYEPRDVTDAFGIRVVTLFHRDIVDATQYILNMANHDEKVAHSPFVKRGVREVLILTSRPEGDPLSIGAEIQKVVAQAGHADVCKPPQASETGYSSIHLILDVPVSFEVEINKTQKDHPLPIEVQIRSVFEDAWGEVDHKLRYSENRKVDATRRASSPWQPHLNALKVYLDGCDQHADVIKTQALDVRSQERIVPAYIPFESIQSALQVCANLDDNFQIQLRSAYAARERLETALTPIDKARAAIDMVERFEAIERDFHEILQSGTDESKELYFNVKMEEAFGALFTQRPDSFERAAQIYRKLRQDYPHPVVLYRLGQIYYDRKQYDLARKYYEEAARLLEKSANIPSRHWLRSGLPRAQALVGWRKSQMLPETIRGQRERLRLFEKAFDYAKQAVDAAEAGSASEASARNSLLYYGVEYLLACRTQKDRSKIAFETLKPTLNILAARLHLASTNETRTLDTMCRAYRMFGEIGQAKKVAQRVEELIESLNTQGDPDEKEMLRYARETLGLGEHSQRKKQLTKRQKKQ